MTLICYQNVVGQPAAAPVTLDRRRRRLSGVMRRHVQPGRPFIVSVHRQGSGLVPNDETVRLRAEWRNTLVAGGDVVLVTFMPMGGGSGGGKQIAGALAAIALAVAAPYAAGALAPAFGLGAIGSKLLAAGIVIGGSMLLSRATQAKADEKTDTREVYGVSGGGNMPRPADRIPRLYGRCWTTPDLTQADYSIYEGDDQVLYKRLTLSLGKVKAYSVRLGDQLLWTLDGGVTPNFSGAEVELIAPGQRSNLIPDDVVTSPNVTGIALPKPEDEAAEWTNAFPVSPAGVVINRIQLDWSFPAGIYRTNDEGELREASGEVFFEYAPIGPNNEVTGAWSPLFTERLRKKTQKAVRRTQIVDVPEGRYAVRARESGRFNHEQNEYTNQSVWDALRGYRRDQKVRPHVTELGIKIRASAATGNISVNEVEVECAAILPIWTGTAWVEEETRQAVWAYLDVLRNATYGAAMSDARIDAEVARHYASTLTAFDRFNGIIRGPVSVYDAASTILGVMRAEPVYIGRIWSLARDEPKSGPAHLITARQVVKGTTTVTYETAAEDGASDIIVEYERDGDPRKLDEVRVTYGAPSLTPQRRRLTGVRTYDHAVHLARWIAASGYYRRKSVQVGVEHEGRIFQRGDRANIPVWFLDNSRPRGVEGRSGNTLLLDQPTPAGSHAILRRRDGLEWGPVAVQQGADPFELVLNAADVAAVSGVTGKTLGDVLANERQDQTTVLIGDLAELTQGYLIKEVRASAPDRHTISAVIDHPGVWNAVGEPIPAAPPLPSGVAAPLAPVVPWVRAHVTQEAVSTLHYQVGAAPGAVEYRVEMAYNDAAAGFEPEWQRIDAGGPFPYGSAQITYDGEQPQILVRAWAIGPTGLAGPIVQTVVDALPPVFPPPADGSVAYATLADDIRKDDAWWQDKLQRVDEKLEQIAADIASGNTGRWLQAQSLRTEVRAATDRVAVRVSQAFFAGVTDNEAFGAILEELKAQLGEAAGQEVEVAANAFRNMAVNVKVNDAAIDGLGGDVDDLYEAVATVEEGVEATVGQMLASGKIRFSAVAGSLPANVAARVAVEVRAGTQQNFRFAGMYLDAMASGTSRIVMKADLFAIGDANGIAYPFVFDAATGKMYIKRQESFDGKMIQDFENKYIQIGV